MTGFDRDLTDQELDRLLSSAGSPSVPKGFEQRMAARIAAEAGSNVVPFPVRIKAKARPMSLWPIPAALAASLVLGFWLGNQNPLSTMLDGLTETAMLGSASDFGPSGLDDIGAVDTDAAS